MSFNFDFNFDLDSMNADLDRVNAKNQPSGQPKNNKYVVLPNGECVHTVRILPSIKPNRNGLMLPYATTRLHYFQLDPENPKTRRNVHCLVELDDRGRWKNVGQCPFCNYYSFLFEQAKKAKTADAAEALKARGRTFKPIERFYYNVIERKVSDPETKEVMYNVGPKIWATGISMHDKVLRAFCGSKKFDEPAIGNVAHPFTGRDFKIVKELKKGENYPDYSRSAFAMDESVAGDKEQIEKWLSELHDLEGERYSNLKTADELQHYIDIIIGKVKDDSRGFDSSKLDLPLDMQEMVGVSRKEKPTVVNRDPVVRETATATTTKPTPAPAVNDTPFGLDDEDQLLVDSDWMNEINSFSDLEG